MPFNQITMIMTCPKQNCIGFFCCLWGFLLCFLNLLVTYFLSCWSNTAGGCTRQQLLVTTCREPGTLLLDCRVGMPETRYFAQTRALVLQDKPFHLCFVQRSRMLLHTGNRFENKQLLY